MCIFVLASFPPIESKASGVGIMSYFVISSKPVIVSGIEQIFKYEFVERSKRRTILSQATINDNRSMSQFHTSLSL